MSSASAIAPFDPENEEWWSKESSGLAKRLCEVSLFMRRWRVQMRFGELSRAPLELVRFQIKERVAECDWLARRPDPWDDGLHPDIGRRHASLQALKDAVEVRSLLFYLLPDVDAGFLRIYRRKPAGGRDLIIAGHVQRVAPRVRNIRSIGMRAKLLGFAFSLQNDMLAGLKEMSNMDMVDW